ncbi:hypothetical protein [Stutzerimonas stutzeri]|uniref:hypothetical protein n=1 Tax=Stutzerimonas stutzeri TaxID=316 RepID=UPI00210B7863|nr:hypothetical protein [Stutzerimonas stutzeri]MCQ4322225.1 hypothetical protein [Stutzerimonas stutzeri]
MLGLVLKHHAVTARERTDRARQAVVAGAFGLEAIQGVTGQQVSQDEGLLAERMSGVFSNP